MIEIFKERCDLHIHSNFSDSDADLEAIFKIAHKIKKTY